jgi:hypothetical protein
MTKDAKLLVLFDFYMHVKFGGESQAMCPFTNKESDKLQCVDLCGALFYGCRYAVETAWDNSPVIACMCPCVHYGNRGAMKELLKLLKREGFVDA